MLNIGIPDERHPKKSSWRTTRRKRSQGGQKKRYKNNHKASTKDLDILMGSWEQTAQERSKWRGLFNKGAALYEEERICEAERKRRERIANTNGPPADHMTLTCSTCNRYFKARIGLVIHQPTNKQTWTLFFKARQTKSILRMFDCCLNYDFQSIWQPPWHSL